MSVFKDQYVLEDLIQELKKKNTALSFGPLQSNGHISVQGSFPAIKMLRDCLLLKAKSLSEDKNEERKSRQRQKKQQQQCRLTTDTNNFVLDAEREKQVVVLDTDIYLYMKNVLPKKLLANTDVVISDITDGDITTLYLQKTRSRPNAAQVLAFKEEIERQSLKLHNTLCKERIYLEEYTRDEKQKYKLMCETLKSHYPSVLVIPYATHIDVIGNSSEVFEFTREVNKEVQSLFQHR